jgi:hypothetical protein
VCNRELYYLECQLSCQTGDLSLPLSTCRVTLHTHYTLLKILQSQILCCRQSLIPKRCFVTICMFVWFPLLIFYSNLKFLTVHKKGVCKVCPFKTTVLYLLVRAYRTQGHISVTSSSLTWNCAHSACFYFVSFS